MELSSLIEVICAVHLSSRVQGPEHGRSGLMLVGPPEALKSTFLKVLDNRYADAMVLSDLNVKSLVRLTQGPLATGAIRTLVFPELAKLYERQDVTSANLEGAMRALVAEGFSGASFQEPGVNRLVARATILGALTPSTVDDKAAHWNDSGYSRRFLWSVVRLENPEMLQEAIDQWEYLDVGVSHLLPGAPVSGIPNLTTIDERRALQVLVKYQPPHGGEHTLQRSLLVRVLAVLKWWYTQCGRDPRHAMRTVKDFAVSLGQQGAAVRLPKQVWHNVRRAARELRPENKEAVARARERVTDLATVRRITVREAGQRLQEAKVEAARRLATSKRKRVR